MYKSTGDYCCHPVVGIRMNVGVTVKFYDKVFKEGQLSVYWQKYVHEVLIYHLGGLSLLRKSVGTG